ncbi:hypothetical protein K435DRAFT_874923 [Dendrothele bispora CBS 962.96]|uniref:Uncharacterized protein n=1 Tax=Dendrothele bispora (strain CBS 962.96) TaxID=1314807 RepID=A0A4S8KVJ5_DENBC|nr:hypothetical protein K435DRAFT_874923 [Dendrothele bispora CBS 962.96]
MPGMVSVGVSTERDEDDHGPDGEVDWEVFQNFGWLGQSRQKIDGQDGREHDNDEERVLAEDELKSAATNARSA